MPNAESTVQARTVGLCVGAAAGVLIAGRAVVRLLAAMAQAATPPPPPHAAAAGAASDESERMAAAEKELKSAVRKWRKVSGKMKKSQGVVHTGIAGDKAEWRRAWESYLEAVRSGAGSGGTSVPRLFADRPMVLYLVVRTELKMGKGKIAAQCGHAATSAVNRAWTEVPGALTLWMDAGMPTVVLRAQAEDELLRIEADGNAAGLVTASIRDAGHTQIAANSLTVVAVGPAYIFDAERVVGPLAML